MSKPVSFKGSFPQKIVKDLAPDLIEQLSRIKDCPDCGNRWPRKPKIKRTFSFRLGDRVVESLARICTPGRFIAAKVYDYYGLCFTCGQKRKVHLGK